MDDPVVLVSDEEAPPSSSLNNHPLKTNGSNYDSQKKDSPPKNPKPSLLLFDKTTSKDSKKTKAVNKRRNPAKKDKLDSAPFWINSPKNLKDIPSHIKLVCDRLIHVEKQIKKFCVERQGLLSALWKFKGEGYGELFPDPVLKSLTVHDSEDKTQEEETQKLENTSQDFELSKELNYNNLDDPKVTENKKLWSSSWLSVHPEDSPTKTPTIKHFASNSSTRSVSSCDFGPVSSIKESKQSTHTTKSDETKDHQDSTKESVLFFKNLDFATLSQTDMNTWRKFFGLKKMPESDLVEELKKIREYLLSFLDA